MLQTQAVEPALLELLKKLMEVNLFRPFVLVGGTSLALQIGHRISVDLDLFGNQELDELEFTDILKGFGSTTILKKSKNILIYSVNGVKLECPPKSVSSLTCPWVVNGDTDNGGRFSRPRIHE